jgi:hypothetical protein
MVKVKRNEKIMEVPNSVFENKMKANGWELVTGKESKKSVEANETVENESSPADESFSDEEWEEAESDVEEKPLSMLSTEELKELADKKGIDISGLKSDKQIREAIRKADKQ